MRIRLVRNVVIVLFFIPACLLSEKKERTATGEPPRFVLPEIPVMLTSPGERAAFLVKHYWRNYDFSDTLYLHYPDVTEQAIVDYIDILNHVPAEKAGASLKETLAKAEADKRTFLFFLERFEQYLYDPNSPVRNEAFYIPVLEFMISSSETGDAGKTRAHYRLEWL